MSHPRRGFTFTDLLIVLVMLALLVPVLPRLVSRSRETANRVKCGSNLRQVGQAMLLYANENAGQYPRTTHRPGSGPTQYTGVRAVNPFAPDGPRPNDVTAAVFLLLRTQDITANVFVCPSTPLDAWDLGGRAVSEVSNFPGEQHLSYSLANPYPGTAPTTAPATAAAFRWDDKLSAEFAVAADMNPGVSGGYDVTAVTTGSAPRDMQKANSRNHQGAGENVLYGDGHVEFQQNPFCGVDRDNIYTVSGSSDGKIPTSSTIVGPPRWAGDSVLLPVAAFDPHRATFAPSASAALVTVGIGMIVLIVGFVIVTRRRQSSPAAN